MFFNSRLLSSIQKDLTNCNPNEAWTKGRSFDEGSRVGRRPEAWTNLVQGSRGCGPVGQSLARYPGPSDIPPFWLKGSSQGLRKYGLDARFLSLLILQDLTTLKLEPLTLYIRNPQS